jgi:DegV family protein with EDD domain
VAAFQNLFAELGEKFDGIVAVLISSDLSGTVESAQLAAANLPDVPIEVIDTRAVTASLGLIVLAAARAAAEGKDLEAVTQVVRNLIDKTHIYFVVDTLEYLHRGGRIGAAAKLLGSVLKMKPILAIEKGVVVPLSRVRTKRKALATVQDMVQNVAGAEGSVHLNVFHVAAREEAVQFGLALEQQFQPVEMVLSECGPVIGAHVGPGTVGAAFYVE